MVITHLVGTSVLGRCRSKTIRSLYLAVITILRKRYDKTLLSSMVHQLYILYSTAERQVSAFCQVHQLQLRTNVDSISTHTQITPRSSVALQPVFGGSQSEIVANFGNVALK